MQLFKNVISLNQAAKISGYTQDYLGSLIRSGDIKGVKKGGIWFTTEGEITHYISKQKAVHRKLAVKDFLQKVTNKKLAVKDFISHISPRNFLVSSLVLFVAFSSTGFYFFKKYDSSLVPTFRTPSFVLASTAFTSKIKNISLPTFPTLPTFPNPFPTLKKIGKVYVDGIANARESVESSSRDFAIAKINSVKEFSSSLIAFKKEKISELWDLLPEGKLISASGRSNKKVSSVAIAKNKINVGRSLTDISDGLAYGWGAFIGGLIDNGENSLNKTKEFASTLGSSLVSSANYLSKASQIKIDTTSNLASVGKISELGGQMATVIAVKDNIISAAGRGVSSGWESFIGGIINNAKGSANGFSLGVDSFVGKIRSSARAFLGITDVNPKIYIQEIPVIVKVADPLRPSGTSPLAGGENTNTGSTTIQKIYITDPRAKDYESQQMAISELGRSILPRIQGIELAILNNISHNSVQTIRIYDSAGSNLASAIHNLTQSGTFNSPTLTDSTFANFTSTGRSDFTRVPTLAHSFTTWPNGTSNASNATLYINPASSVGNGNLIGASVADVVKFIVDAEGSIYANSLVLTGSVTSGATTVASLSVLDNTILGDAGTDTLTVNSGSTFNNNISQVGAYTFSTGTSAVSLNGDTTIATGKAFTVTNGTTGILGATTINTSGSNATNIGTGTNAGTITIGNITTGDLALNDANWNITGLGAANFTSIGVATQGSGAFTTLTSSGATTLATGASLTNTFGSGTGAINTFGNATGTNALNGSTTILGTTLINTTNTSATTIGNATGLLTLHGATTLDNTFLQSGAYTFGTGTGAVSLNGATSVTGTNTFNVGTGTSTFGGNILASTGSIDIGSTGTHFGTVYADNVTASNIYGTIVTGSTSANDWTINSDNATVDTENMSLAFERGDITPNATLVWDATGKKFILNAPLELASTIGTATFLSPGLITATSGLTSNGAVTVQNNSNFIQSGTGTFSTGTGTVSLNGDTTIATGKTFTVTNGTTNITGATTILGTTLINTTNTLATTIGNATGLLTLHGATTLDNTFTVSGTNLTSLGGNLTVTGTAWTATPTISGLITGTLGVSIGAGQSYTGAGAVTLSSAAASPLTLNSGTTGDINIGTDASAETINIGNTGAAGKIINIGNNATAGTIITIGSATNTDLALLDPNWSVTGAGAATFSSISGAISGAAGSFTTLTSSGASTIGTGASLTNTFGAGTDAINTFGNATGTNTVNGTTNITGATTILGTTLINTTNTSATTIGNSTGTLALAGTTFALTSGSGLNVTTLGALSGITTIATSSTINSQTISATASFTGTLNVATGYKVNNAATTGTILRGDGTNFIQSTLILPNTGTLYTLPVYTSANTMGEVATVGATGEYLKGNTGAIPSWATLNQAAIAGLTTSDTPQFARLGLGVAADAVNILTATSAATSDLSKTLNISHTGAITTGAGTGYAGYFSKTGASTTNVGLYATATGATNNYSLQVDSGAAAAGTYTIYANGAAKNYFAGNIGIGDAAPGTNLSVVGTAQIGYTSGQTVSAGTSLAVSGNVGIGTTGPSTTLHMRPTGGGMFTEGLKIERGSVPTQYTILNHLGGATELTSVVEGGGGYGSMLFNASNNGSSYLERMRIDANGNVGIGTVTPNYAGFVKALTVAGGASEHVAMEVAGTWTSDSAGQGPTFAGYNISGNTRLGQMVFDRKDANNSGEIAFWTNNAGSFTQKMVIDKTGNVGIGTTGPMYKLDVNGVIRATNSTVAGKSYLYMGAVKSSDTYQYDLGGMTAIYNDSSWNSATVALLGPALNGYTAPIEYMTFHSDGTNRITSMNGNVGIGTTGPISNLDIGGSTNPQVLTIGKVSVSNAAINSPNAIVVNIDSANLTTNTQYFAIARDQAGLSGGTELFRVQESGNVGIGTTNPLISLDVGGGGMGISGVSSATPPTGLGYGMFQYSGVGLGFYSGASGATQGIGFWTKNGAASPAETVRILSNGNVGIGTTNPGYKLEVGSASVTGIVARFVNVSGSCDINPTTTALVCPSDINLKKNITTIKDDKEFALQTVPTDMASKSTFDKLMTLTPIKYNWKTEPDTATKHVGFIAQEVEQIFPDLVFTDPVTGVKSLATTNLLPYTIEAIQEMNLKLGEIGDMSKPNIFRTAISSWLENSSNKITRIFTGEVCLTDADGQTECINRAELKSLKGLMTATVVVPTCTATQTLANNICVENASQQPATPAAGSCTATQTLVNNVCTDPAVVDLTAYNTALGAKVEVDYTPESWATYKIVLDANVVTTSNTQAQVDTATTNITTAQGSLAPKI